MEEEGNILRKKIQEREEALAIKISSAKDQLEGRIARSQRSLEQAEAAKQAALRDIRQLERRIDEIATQATEERKRARDYEESKSKIDEQLKKMEVRLYDAKLECSLENARRLDVKRQLDVATERREKLKRELAAVCNALGSPRSATGRSARARNDIHDLLADRWH
ncbi:hypothetical protein HPB50_002847 [Hyalomma asiaticum]|uniref:Uncharacterized protein n=1 Tax=Hyalomma asiaticum TaxID=266040 RepID=A0ACB7SG18_HYAAI|nr:hypothetical protein HPB50_002847 [Hyalomma asiaticum]